MGKRSRFRAGLAVATLAYVAACGGGGGRVISDPTERAGANAARERPTGAEAALAGATGTASAGTIGVRAAPIAFDATPLAEPEWPSPVVPATATPSTKPSVRPYALPLTERRVENLERDLKSKQIVVDRAAVVERLLREGFAIGKPARDFDQFSDAYNWLSSNGVPVSVTVDSLLHFQHVYFAELLKAIELQQLAPMLRSLLSGIHRELVKLGERAGGKLSEPALRELAYVSVALQLLDPRFSVHPDVASRVARDLASIERHQGLAPSFSLSTPKCRICYDEDFSQYVPRGHYTQSDALKRYFKASMWLGRIGHRMKHDDEIVQQLLLVQAVKKARCQWGDKTDLPAAELLGRIDRVLDLFVGQSDDLDVFDLDRVQTGALKAGTDLHAAASAENVEVLRAAVRKLRPPRILSGAIQGYGESATDTIKHETQGLRLLGQRHAADSEMLGRLVWEFAGPNPKHARFRETVEDALNVPSRKEQDPCALLSGTERSALKSYSCTSSTPRLARCLCERAVELHDDCLSSDSCRAKSSEVEGTAFSQVCRLMPSALDVASVLGSQRAQELTSPGAAYCGFAEQRRALQAEWKPGAAGFGETLYSSWLQALRPLFNRVGPGYPTYMHSRTYQDKSLRTALASWTELRHDTVLHVKHSYTAHGVPVSGDMVLRDPKFYATVEPRSDVIRSLRSQVARTRAVLSALSVLSDSMDTSLAKLDATLGRLQDMADRQLKDRALQPADGEWLMGIGRLFDSLVVDLAMSLVPLRSWQKVEITRESLREAARVTLVTDVHTDLNTRRVLEQGLGQLELGFFVSRNGDGKLSVSAGPIFSHREFVHRLDDRLTNEKWRKLVDRDAVDAPAWWKNGTPLANGYQLFCTEETPGCAPAARK